MFRSILGLERKWQKKFGSFFDISGFSSKKSTKLWSANFVYCLLRKLSICSYCREREGESGHGDMVGRQAKMVKPGPLQTEEFLNTNNTVLAQGRTRNKIQCILQRGGLSRGTTDSDEAISQKLGGKARVNKLQQPIS